MSATAEITTRHDWSLAEVRALFEQPFNDLLFQAQSIHRQHFDPGEGRRSFEAGAAGQPRAGQWQRTDRAVPAEPGQFGLAAAADRLAVVCVFIAQQTGLFAF